MEVLSQRWGGVFTEEERKASRQSSSLLDVYHRGMEGFSQRNGVK
jgi:hypothetical protein